MLIEIDEMENAVVIISSQALVSLVSPVPKWAIGILSTRLYGMVGE